MPLSKTIEVNNTGVNATYWVIDTIEFRLISVITWCKLNGYVSSAAYQAGKSPLTDRGFSAPTPGTFATMAGSDMIAAVQGFILTQPEFVGGIVVS